MDKGNKKIIFLLYKNKTKTSHEIRTHLVCNNVLGARKLTKNIHQTKKKKIFYIKSSTNHACPNCLYRITLSL